MPQRRAAVKATANLKDADKPMTKKEEELVLFGEPENKKKKEAEEKAAKKKALEPVPLWKRYVHISIFCFDLNFSSLSNIGQIVFKLYSNWSLNNTLLFLFSRLGSPLSSDSDSLGEEPFPFRSPRGTSSRGRATAGTTKPRSPRKSYKVFFLNSAISGHFRP